MRGIILGIYFTLFLSVAGWAQDANNLAVDATVKDAEGGRLTDAIVKLYRDGALVNKVSTGRNGRFDLYLDFGYEYIIEISKPGFAAKRLYFNTHNVPEDEQIWGYEFGGFIVDLFRDVPGIDFSVLDEPVGKVYYESRIQNFEYDREYIKLKKQELDKLEELYKKQLALEEQRLRQLEEDYKVAMRDGQLALDAKDFITAKENFLAASSLKPNAPEPNQKLAEVEKALERESGLEEKYLAVLATADDLYGSEAYAEAKAKYNEALGIKPNESYPAEQVKKCDEGIARKAREREEQERLKQQDEQYNALIATADKEFTNQSYEAARRYYNEAAGIKPGEAYPSEQIGKIDALLAEARAEEEARKKAGEAQRQYQELISQGDQLFGSKGFEQAIAKYESALELNPSEAYPRERIAEARKAMERLDKESKRAKTTEAYRELISEADGLMGRKDYEAARSKYEEALALKPGEEHPKTQIEKIGKELARLAREVEKRQQKQVLDDQYASVIESGDIAFEAENYDEARSQYETALDMKPDEAYPRKQLEAIEMALSRQASEQEAERERQQKMKEYENLISRADGLFRDENYTEAAAAYNEALKLRPNEVYPKTQLDVIAMRQKDLANSAQQLEENEKKYEAAILSADRAFDADNLTKAEEGYRLAASLKPNESYPKERLFEIDERKEALLAKAQMEKEGKRKRTEYENTLVSADKMYEGKKLAEARHLYERALELYPDETYPADRIAQIEEEYRKIQADQLERERMNELTEKYNEYITRADAFLKSNDLQMAKETYKKALEIKPEEVYPKNQMAKIEQLMKQIATEEARMADFKQRYKSWIERGDQAIVNKDWTAARKAFQEALKIFPEEKIPKERLLELDNLESREKELVRKQTFDKLIERADREYLNRNFEEARRLYNESLQYFPNSQHPKERIVRIGKILEELAEQNYEPEERDLEKKIVEETYEEGNRTITIRRVIIGEKEEEYKRVVHPWGGKYYFLNNRPISELVWMRETSTGQN